MASKSKNKNKDKNKNDKITPLELQNFFIDVYDKIQELDYTVNGLLGHKINALDETQIMRQDIENLQVRCDSMQNMIQQICNTQHTLGTTKINRRKIK